MAEFARLVHSSDQRLQSGDGGGTSDGMEPRIARLEALAESQDQRLGRVETRLDSMDERIRQVEKALGEIKGRLDNIPNIWVMGGFFVAQIAAIVAIIWLKG